MRFLILLIALAFPTLAHAQDLAGRWLFSAGGQPLIEVTVTGTDADRRVDYRRPQALFLSGTMIEKVEGPIITYSGGPGEWKGDRLYLTLSAEGEKDKTIILAALSDDRIELALPRTPVPGLVLHRIEAPATLSLWDGDPLPIVRDFPDNAQMAAMFKLDQEMRMVDGPIDWKVVSAKDEEHRLRTLELLEAGALHTGADFERAAFIFQHGGDADSYLMAHIMATTAMKLGEPGAEWIAAASLDRFLQSIDRPQVFGTQSLGMPGEDGDVIWSFGDYDEDMITDEIRFHHSVPPLPEQKARLEARKNGE